MTIANISGSIVDLSATHANRIGDVRVVLVTGPGQTFGFDISRDGVKGLRIGQTMRITIEAVE